MSGFKIGTVTLEVKLPPAKPCCLYCWNLRKDGGLDRSYCHLTRAIIPDVRIIDPTCPIEWEEEDGI